MKELNPPLSEELLQMYKQIQGSPYVGTDGDFEMYALPTGITTYLDTIPPEIPAQPKPKEKFYWKGRIFTQGEVVQWRGGGEGEIVLFDKWDCHCLTHDGQEVLVPYTNIK